MPVTKAAPSRVKHWKTVHFMSTSHLIGRCDQSIAHREALRQAQGRLLRRAQRSSFDRLRINFQLRLHPFDPHRGFVSAFRCMGGRMPPHRPAGMRALPQADAGVRPPQFVFAGFTRTSFAGATTLGTLTEAAMISFFCPMSCGTQTVVIPVVELPDSSVNRMTIV